MEAVFRKKFKKKLGKVSDKVRARFFNRLEIFVADPFSEWKVPLN